MKYRAFWINDRGNLEVIDQRLLPHEQKIIELSTPEEVVAAVKNMAVRGAGTIGSAAAFGVYLAVRETPDDFKKIKSRAMEIRESRPTAVNLMWAVDRMLRVIEKGKDKLTVALEEAVCISDEDVERTSAIGRFGYSLIEKIGEKKSGNTVNILTHCNAGWLGIADSGSALAPIYEAKRNGMKIHVWVDETRPRNQGALTAWELQQADIPHTVIADNAGGLLMMKGEVDLIFVGADRVASNGDVANKIGTYLKALAAYEHSVPFYVNFPISTFDFETKSGSDIEIEDRSPDEVLYVSGIDESGKRTEVQIYSEKTGARNPAFDITPAKFITGLITERGICGANADEIDELYGDLIAPGDESLHY